MVEHPEISFASMSEEHGHIYLSTSHHPGVGEHLDIVPNHVCACVNMHDRILYHRDSVVESVLKN